MLKSTILKSRSLSLSLRSLWLLKVLCVVLFAQKSSTGRAPLVLPSLWMLSLPRSRRVLDLRSSLISMWTGTSVTSSSSVSGYCLILSPPLSLTIRCFQVELPLNIHNDNATYETQFGYVSRPTHKNTTWDMAKFEVCGHKWADLSEYGYGVAYLSESKYGFACQGNVFRISLLRAPTAPDAEQDQGQ
jgi:hypothetical protein